MNSQQINYIQNELSETDTEEERQADLSLVEMFKAQKPQDFDAQKKADIRTIQLKILDQTTNPLKTLNMDSVRAIYTQFSVKFKMGSNKYNPSSALNALPGKIKSAQRTFTNIADFYEVGGISDNINLQKMLLNTSYLVFRFHENYAQKIIDPFLGDIFITYYPNNKSFWIAGQGYSNQTIVAPNKFIELCMLIPQFQDFQKEFQKPAEGKVSKFQLPALALMCFQDVIKEHQKFDITL